MLPRRPTHLGLGAVREPATPLPAPEDHVEPVVKAHRDPREEPIDPAGDFHDEGALADTLPSTPVAKAYVLPEDDERRHARPKSGVRIRPPLVAEEVAPARRDARWEKD